MGSDGLLTLLGVLDVIRPEFTAPGFRNALVLFAGFLRTQGTHAVTQALVETDVARRRHHEAFHRFFSRGTWSPDAVGKLLLASLLSIGNPGDPVRVVIDDTLAQKKGPHVFGIGSHLDAVRSTKGRKVFAFGHVWVVLAVLIRVPFSSRTWALPVLFRLYRNQKECESSGGTHRKKTELAREMLDIIVAWSGDRTITATADSAYCNATLMSGLIPRIQFFGAMRPDAVLTAPPERERKSRRGGRPPVRGTVKPKPQALARDGRTKWRTCRTTLYGQSREVSYKTLDAQWYRACGAQLVRIVVVKVDTGNLGIRVFFSTQHDMEICTILETYAERWAIEVCFRDLKQLMGFRDSRARKREAVERTAPFLGLVYTIIVIWFARHAWDGPLARPPLRPWYTHKKGLSFADALRAAQRALVDFDVLDPTRPVGDLHQLAPKVDAIERRVTRRAA